MKYTIVSIIIFAISIIVVDVAEAETTQWKKNFGSEMRLVAVKRGKNIIAGLEIKLDEKWKTYWKNSGDSGFPPDIHLRKSQNIKKPIIKMPVPQMFIEDKSIGYKNNVTFIFETELINKNRNAVITMGGTIGVCEEICVPVEIDFRLPVNGQIDDDENQVIVNALAQLPLSQEHSRVKIVDAKFDKNKKLMTVNAIVPEKTQKVEMFVNAPPQWASGIARLTEHSGDNAKFVIETYETRQKIEENMEILIVADGQGIEQNVRIEK